jgi:hypothetical protein
MIIHRGGKREKKRDGNQTGRRALRVSKEVMPKEEIKKERRAHHRGGKKGEKRDGNQTGRRALRVSKEVMPKEETRRERKVATDFHD